MLFLQRIAILLSMLCLFSVSSYGATGTVLITSPVQTTFPVGKAFSMIGTATLNTDTVPTGKVAMPSCLPDATTASVSPTYFENLYYQVSAELRYSFDGIDQGLVSRFAPRDIGKQQKFNVVIRQYQMTGGVHTAKVFLRDIYGAACNSFRRPWPWAEPGDVFAIATYKFTVTQPTLTITMTLNKTSLTPCDAETGTIKVTSNDPTPNGGTVTLTFPDGSTASAAFAGKTAILTFADFGLPNGYTGAFTPSSVLTFTADVRTAAGYTASSSATANVIAGGLTVTMTPDTATVEPWLQDRSISFMQGGKKVTNKKNQSVQARTQNIQIDVIGPLGSIRGAQVQAMLEMYPGAETFGGHDHGINGRPLSTLGSLSPVKEVNGKYNTTYTSSIYASKARIRITASDPYSQCTGTHVSAPFVAKVGGLVQFNTALGINALVGGTCNHHGLSDNKKLSLSCTQPNNNHYLTQASLNKLIKLQQAYAKNYPNRGGLRINDASLPYGGKFEAYNSNLWTLAVASAGHKTHRRGLDVDIGNRDTYDIPGKPPYTVTARGMRKLNERNNGELFAALKDESATANHLHIYFE